MDKTDNQEWVEFTGTHEYGGIERHTGDIVAVQPHHMKRLINDLKVAKKSSGPKTEAGPTPPPAPAPGAPATHK